MKVFCFFQFVLFSWAFSPLWGGEKAVTYRPVSASNYNNREAESPEAKPVVELVGSISEIIEKIAKQEGDDFIVSKVESGKLKAITQIIAYHTGKGTIKCHRINLDQKNLFGSQQKRETTSVEFLTSVSIDPANVDGLHYRANQGRTTIFRVAGSNEDLLVQVYEPPKGGKVVIQYFKAQVEQSRRPKVELPTMMGKLRIASSGEEIKITGIGSSKAGDITRYGKVTTSGEVTGVELNTTRVTTLKADYDRKTGVSKISQRVALPTGTSFGAMAEILPDGEGPGPKTYDVTQNFIFGGRPISISQAVKGSSDEEGGTIFTTKVKVDLPGEIKFSGGTQYLRQEDEDRVESAFTLFFDKEGKKAKKTALNYGIYFGGEQKQEGEYNQSGVVGGLNFSFSLY